MTREESYKRQMDMYVWVLRNKGFDVSNTVLCLCGCPTQDIDGMLTDAGDPAKAWLLFDANIIAYEADPSGRPDLMRHQAVSGADCPPTRRRAITTRGVI